MLPESKSPVWLGRYAAFTAVATLGLIAIGGLVTSHEAGMAVPDWPTTYGYNMFLFPVSQWVGGVFYEHTHRLYASAIGFLTLILAVWIQLSAADRRLPRLGWLALALVAVQGVLGGLRVSLMKDQIGIVHAALAQAFLVLLVVIAVRTSRWFGVGGKSSASPEVSERIPQSRTR
jgi:cytochrome c oxidase assembly protein subunit 15